MVTKVSSSTMNKTLIVLCCLALGYAVLAKPANNELLDKATVNDVAVNTVSPEDGHKKDTATVQISGITTGLETPQAPQDDFQPQKTGSMFARLIDDIFQIPISVLKNVARLITSPFRQTETPKDTVTTSI